jgi:hypothetical protein
MEHFIGEALNTKRREIPTLTAFSGYSANLVAISRTLQRISCRMILLSGRGSDNRFNNPKLSHGTWPAEQIVPSSVHPRM